MQNEIVEQLTHYFEKEPSVLMAFLFGSRAIGTERASSDWDVAVYFKPVEYMETEIEIEYPDEDRIWSALVDILETDDADMVVLNRVRSPLVYNVLRKGTPLVIKDRRLYIDLLCKVSYEATDWWDFVSDYWQISEKAKSIPPEEKSRLLGHLRFLENEFSEIEQIKNFTWQDYLQDSFKRKVIERWIENLVMSMLDIAKIILASQKREIPQTYKDILKVFGTIYVAPSFGERISWFAIMRNILAHEYLDIKWKRITRFVSEAEVMLPLFINTVKEIVKGRE